MRSRAIRWCPALPSWSAAATVRRFFRRSRSRRACRPCSLASCAEWTGVPLSSLLEEAGIDPKAKWVIAEGADAPHLSRSVPLAKAMDDALVALYQNGERIMPGNGYPLRLVLPGWEGNANIKFLRRLQLAELPNMSYYEART